MLETKYVGDNFEMLVTVLTDFVTNILYLLAYLVPVSGHQYRNSVTNIKSTTSTFHQHLCSRLFLRSRRILLTWQFFKFKIISANGKKTMMSISKIFQCGTKEDQRRAWTPRNWTVVITWQHGQNLRRVNSLDYMSQLYQVCSNHN